MRAELLFLTARERAKCRAHFDFRRECKHIPKSIPAVAASTAELGSGTGDTTRLPTMPLVLMSARSDCKSTFVILPSALRSPTTSKLALLNGLVALNAFKSVSAVERV